MAEVMQKPAGTSGPLQTGDTTTGIGNGSRVEALASLDLRSQMQALAPGSTPVAPPAPVATDVSAPVAGDTQEDTQIEGPASPLGDTATSPTMRVSRAAVENNGVTAVYDDTQISTIQIDGVELTVGEGFYVIGSETGEDRPDQNVRSPDSDGNTLFAPGDWPGAPFNLEITGSNPYHIRLSIGPMPTKYATLSVPLDLHKGLFDSFSFSGSGYRVGAGGTWEQRDGNSGRYADVPQPAYIEGHGHVGVAETQISGPGFWAEVSGAQARIRRTVLGGDATQMLFYHHPYTSNIEIGFGGVSKGGHVYHEETLEILAANESTPGVIDGGGQTEVPPGQPGTADGQMRLEALYRGLLGREPDPAGLGTFSGEAASGLTGVQSVTTQILNSAEYQMRRQSLSAGQMLEGLYEGLFDRPLDASGRGTFTPWLEQDRDHDLLEALLTSPELRGRLGL